MQSICLGLCVFWTLVQGLWHRLQRRGGSGLKNSESRLKPITTTQVFSLKGQGAVVVA